MAEPRTWFLLSHSRGPAVPDGEPVMEQPGIAEHYAWLQRRMADGTLVAAGPMGDVEGEGTTVLDVASLEVATELATREDRSVAGGVLAVRVRPWRVVMAPVAD